MSWYVETLLIYRDNIRNNIFNVDGFIINADFENDDYNNLLIVEKKISELFNNGLLAERELEIINAMSTGKSLKSLREQLNLSRWTISDIFSTTCEKIAYSLGGIFTDDGYLEYLTKKHNLNNLQLHKLEKYIRGAYKHKVRRDYD